MPEGLELAKGDNTHFFLDFFGFVNFFNKFATPAPMPMLFVKRSCEMKCDPRSSMLERCLDETPLLLKLCAAGADAFPKTKTNV